MLRLEELSNAWGTTKTNFVNVKNDISLTIGFPVPKAGPNNSHLYPALASLKKMLEYETRNDSENDARAKRAAEILGETGRRKRTVAQDFTHAPNELATLNRLAADIEARERAQRQYLLASEVANIAADAFSIMSETCSNLSNEIDPNGLLPVETRMAVDGAGRSLLIRIHKQMKELLDADSGNVEPAAGVARKARARR